MRERCKDILELSDKRISELAEEKEMWKTQAEKTRAHISDLRKTYRETEVQKAQYAAEAAKYKNLFADEVGKRLRLAEKVSSLEQHISDLEFNLRTTEAELEKTKASTPNEVRAAKAEVIGKVLRMLRFGIPMGDGTLSKDPRDIISTLEKDFQLYTGEGETK